MPGTWGSGNPQGMPPALKDGIYAAFACTQNQWYDLFLAAGGEAAAQCAAGAGSIKKNVRVYTMGLDQATVNETVEVRFIADGIDQTLSQVAVAGTNYYLITESDPDYDIFFAWSTNSPVNNTGSRSFCFECKSLQIMYRKTTNGGANHTHILFNYAQW